MYDVCTKITIIYCKSSPERNKANREIIKELEKLTGCQVRIVGGLTSKKKRIVIDGIAMGSIGGYLGYLIYKKIENTSVVKRIQSE